MEAAPAAPQEAGAEGEGAAAADLDLGTMLPGGLAEAGKPQEVSRAGSLASAPTTDHDPIADDLDEIIRIHNRRLKASQQGAGAAAPAVTRAQDLAKEDETASLASAALSGRPLSTRRAGSPAEEVRAGKTGEADSDLSASLRLLREREEALERREAAINNKLEAVKQEWRKLHETKKKKGLEEELESLRNDLDQIKIAQMHDMVETVDATIKEQQVKCKFMYLTNQQTSLMDISKMPQVSRALSGFQPKMVIRLMPSHFGIEYWNAFKNWSFVRKVDDKDVWDGRFPHKQVPEMSEEEGHQTENRLILFVKEVLLPLAYESHALVIGAECCSLVNAFAKVSAPMVRQYGDQAPFRLLIFARSYFFAQQAKQEGTVAQAVRSKCKQWQRASGDLERALAERYGDDDSFWPQPDLLAGEYSLILFECLTDNKLAVESASHFENDFIQSFAKYLPVIAIQTYGTNKMESCPTVADHANRGMPLFLLDSRKRSEEDNVYKGADTFATFRDNLRQRLEFRQWHLHNKDGEDHGAVDSYTTCLIAYVRDQVNKVFEHRRRGKGPDGESPGGPRRRGSGGQAGKDADKGDAISTQKQKDMWLWQAVLDGRKETRRLAQQSREQLSPKRDVADDEAEKEMQDLLVQVTNDIMEYAGRDIEWESKQLFRRCSEAIEDLRTADSWDSLRRKLDANWLKLRGFTFHKYGKAQDFVLKHKWCQLKNVSQGSSGSRKLAIVPPPPTDGKPGVSFSVANVNYQALCADADLLADFKAAVQDALALAAGSGVERRAVDLVLSAGSVNVLATVNVSEDLRASVLAQLRSSPAVGTNIESRIAGLSGISSVASGDVAVKDLRVLEDVEAVKARDQLVELVEKEKMTTFGFAFARNTMKAFKRREATWISVYDLMKSKDVHVGNLHDVSGVRSELFRLAQRDRLPDANSQEALLLLRRAWVLVDLYMSYARMYKVYAKIFYAVSLLLGVAIVVISVVQPAMPNDFDEKTAQYTLLGLGLCLSGVAGASTVVDPTTKWLALRGAALAMESEIWKFRARVGEYRGVSKAGTGLPRQEAERQALQEFHFRIDALQESVQQSSGLKDTGFYAQTTATDDSEDEDEPEKPTGRGSAVLASVFGALGVSRRDPGRGPQAGGEPAAPRDGCCCGILFCPRRCRCGWRCCSRGPTSVEPLIDRAREERMKARAQSAVTRSKLLVHGQYKSSRSLPTKTQDLDNFHSPANMAVYIKFRLVPQMCFYQKRIPRYYRLRRFYQTLLLVASIINAILAAVQEPTWTAIVSSASGAFAAWQEFSSIAKKLERYSTASSNLSNILLWWQALPDVDQADVRHVESLVETVETLLGGERAAWLSDAQQALKGAKQAKDKEGGEEKKEGPQAAGK